MVTLTPREVRKSWYPSVISVIPNLQINGEIDLLASGVRNRIWMFELGWSLFTIGWAYKSPETESKNEVVTPEKTVSANCPHPRNLCHQVVMGSVGITTEFPVLFLRDAEAAVGDTGGNSVKQAVLSENMPLPACSSPPSNKKAGDTLRRRKPYYIGCDQLACHQVRRLLPWTVQVTDEWCVVPQQQSCGPLALQLWREIIEERLCSILLQLR